MSSEAHSAREARDVLQSLGFGLVQRQPSLLGPSGVRPDLIAWASDGSGDLVPWAAVEFTTKKAKSPDLLLPALARSRDLLGTQDHYALVDGQWFKADRAVRSLEPVGGPVPPIHGGGGWLKDEDLATSLLSMQISREVARQRFPDGDDGSPPWFLYDTNVPGIQISDDEFVPVDYEVLHRARRRAIVNRLLGDKSTGMYVSNPVIADAVAALVGDRLGGKVIDPFCGTGSFLWPLIDRAVQEDLPAEFLGFEQNSMIGQAAQLIGRGERRPTTIERADAYQVEMPEAEIVVTAPPLGLRLTTPRQMLDGSATTDGEAAAVDLSLRILQPGGRAVLHLSTGFTSRALLERYRKYLANEFRVAALIGLPAGAIPGTAVRSTLLVIDRAKPGESFVAQLGEDWEVQIGRGGAAIEAALAHIDGAGPASLGQP